MKRAEEIKHTLTGPIEQARGVIGRYPDPGERYVFEFDSVAPRPIHMLGVRRPLRVRWLTPDGIETTKTLRPWVGSATHRADLVIEERP